MHEEGCSAHAGTSHGAQSRTGAAAGSDAAVEALRALTLLVTTSLSDASLPPKVLQGLRTQQQPLAGSPEPKTQDAGAAGSDSAALSSLRRMAAGELEASQAAAKSAPASE